MDSWLGRGLLLESLLFIHDWAEVAEPRVPPHRSTEALDAVEEIVVTVQAETGIG